MFKKLFVLIGLLLPIGVAHSDAPQSDEKREPIKIPPEKIVKPEPQQNPYQKQDKQQDEDDAGVVSVSLRDPYDMNWRAAIDAGAPGSPMANPIVLPFLPSRPIENIEIKFKLFDRKF